MDKIICGIYKIESPTDRIYIGRSVNIYKRWGRYKYNPNIKQAKLFASLQKHGAKAHTFEVLEECIDKELNDREIFWIKHYNTFGTEHGLNLREGGIGGRVSEQTKDLLRVINTGKKHSPETKAKLSLISRGKVTSQETKQKQSIIHKGRKMPQTMVDKIIQLNKDGIISMKGKKHSEATIAKMKLFTHTDETKAHIKKIMTGKKYPLQRVHNSNNAQRRLHAEGEITVWNKGVPMSEKAKQNLRDFYKRKIELNLLNKESV